MKEQTWLDVWFTALEPYSTSQQMQDLVDIYENEQRQLREVDEVHEKEVHEINERYAKIFADIEKHHTEKTQFLSY